MTTGREMGLREMGRVIARYWRTILAAALAGAAAGVLLAVRSTPYYEADVAIRIESSPLRIEEFEPAPNADVVATEMEEIQTTALLTEVVSRLGLGVRVVEPEGIPRSAVLAAAWTPDTARAGVYSLERTRGGGFVVRGADGASRPSVARPGDAFSLGSGVVVTLAPAAARFGHLELEVVPPGGVVADLRTRLMVSRPNPEADVIRVRYQDADPVLARDVANAVAAHYLKQREETRAVDARRALRVINERLARLGAGRSGIPLDPGVESEVRRLLQTRLLLVEVAEPLSGPGARVIDPAVLPARPVRPRRSVVVVLATVVGLVAGLAVAFTRAQLDDRLYSGRQAARVAGVPVLGVVPRLRASRRARGPRWMRRRPRPDPVPLPAGDLEATDEAAEAYRALRARVVPRPDGTRSAARVLLVTSAVPREGKTTTAANLALAAAGLGIRVLLVDADLRRRAPAADADPSGKPGLAGVLQGNAAVDGAVRTVRLENGVHSLDFVPGGGGHPDPAAVLGSPRAAEVLRELTGRYDLVLVDTPSLRRVDPLVLGPGADAALLVVRHGVTRAGDLARAVEQLRGAGVQLAGLVVNDARGREGAEFPIG